VIIMETKPTIHWPSIGMLVLSGGGIFLSSLTGGLFLFLGVFGFIQDPSETSQFQGMINLVVISSLVALVLLPSAIFAVIRLMGKPVPQWRLAHESTWANIGIVLVPVLIVSGIFVSMNRYISFILLPLLQIGIVILPLIWLLVTTRRNLSLSSSQHNWGLATFSLTVTVPFIIFTEAVIVLVLVVAGVMYLKTWNPGLTQEFSVTLNRLMSSGGDNEAILRIIRPYFSQPIVLYSVFAVMAGLIPLMEELLKPLALWFFASRPLTPKEGFLGGMICGAAFALFESLGSLVSIEAVSWASVAIGRIGTGILHVTASGLVGWGMAKAWSEGRIGMLAGAYIAAFGLHSLWNLSALMTGFRELAQASPVMVNSLIGIVQASPFVLVMLASFMVSILMKANILLQKAELPENN